MNLHRFFAFFDVKFKRVLMVRTLFLMVLFGISVGRAVYALAIAIKRGS